MESSKLNDINHKYWVDWWEHWPDGKQGINSINLRPNTFVYEDMFKELDRLFKFEKDWHVLDVGCGSAELSKLILNKVNRVTACDRSSAMIKEARRITKGVKNLKVEVADAVELPYTGKTFDATLSMAVVQYVDKFLVSKYVDEMLRVTKDGSRVLIGDVIPVDKKYDEANVTQIPKDYWEKTNKWWKAKKVEIVPSSYEDRYHVILHK